MSLTYDTIDAHVRKKYIPVLVDQFFTANPLLLKLLEKSKIEFDSGSKIVQPVQINKLTGNSYSGTGNFDVDEVETDTIAEWDWKNNYVNVTISGDAIDKVEGDEKVISIVESKMNNARMTLNDQVSVQILLDGSGNTNRDMDGLMNAIDNGGTYPIYGGINVLDAPTWKSYLDTTGGSISYDMITSAIGKVTYGTEKPDLIIMSQPLYDALKVLLQPQQRYLDPKSTLGVAGFSGLQIDDTQIVVEPHLADDRVNASDVIYGLNTKYLKFVIHRNKAFKWTEKKVPINQDAYIRQLLLKANLICTSRRMHFKLTNVTP